MTLSHPLGLVTRTNDSFVPHGVGNLDHLEYFDHFDHLGPGWVCCWPRICLKWVSSLELASSMQWAFTKEMSSWSSAVSRVWVASSVSQKSCGLCGHPNLPRGFGVFLNSLPLERSTPVVVSWSLLWALKSLWQCWCLQRRLLQSCTCSCLQRDRLCLLGHWFRVLQFFHVAMVCTCSDETCNARRTCWRCWRTLIWTRQPRLWFFSKFSSCLYWRGSWAPLGALLGALLEQLASTATGRQHIR